MAISIWGFSAKFAVYEPAPGEDVERCDKSHAKPLPSEWVKPTLAETFEVRGKPAPPGDFPGTTGFMHLLSPHAMECVGNIFTAHGIAYPVEIEGQESGWHMFHPTSVVDCLNLEASKVDRLSFRPDTICSVLVPVFHEAKVPQSGLFVVPQCRDGDVYVCDDVKAAVKKKNLRGFVLSKEFFGKPWIS